MSKPGVNCGPAVGRPRRDAEKKDNYRDGGGKRQKWKNKKPKIKYHMGAQNKKWAHWRGLVWRMFRPDPDGRRGRGWGGGAQGGLQGGNS